MTVSRLAASRSSQPAAGAGQTGDDDEHDRAQRGVDPGDARRRAGRRPRPSRPRPGRPRRGRGRQPATSSRLIGPPVAVEPDRPSGQPSRPRTPGVGFGVRTDRQVDDPEAGPAEPPGDRQPVARVAGRHDHDQRSRPDHPGEPTEQVLERRRRVGADPGQEVAGPAGLVLAGARSEERHPLGGAGERGDREAAGSALGLELAGQRGRHDAQRLGQVVVVPPGPGAVRGLDIERDDDVPIARRIEPLDQRDAQPGGRPPVDVPDRIARRVRAHAANRARVLDEAAPRAQRSGPIAGRLEPADGHGPGPDDERRGEVTVLVGDGLAEQVARRQPDRGEPVDAPVLGPEPDPPDRPLVRSERPAVDQGPAADRAHPDLGAAHRLELGRQRLLGPEPGQRQQLPVPDGDDEMGVVAAHHPVRLEPPLEPEPAQGASRPQPAQPGDDEDDDPEHDEDRDPEDPTDEDEQAAEERPEIELGRGDGRGQARVVVGLRVFAGVAAGRRPARGRVRKLIRPGRGRCRPGPGRRPRYRPGSGRRSRHGASCRGRPAADGRAPPGRSPGCRRAGRSRGPRGTPRPGRPGTARRSRAGSPPSSISGRSRVAATIATR